MPPNQTLRLTPLGTLRALLALRVVAVLAQLAVLALAVERFHFPLPLPPMLAGVAVLALLAVGLGWRLRRPWPVTELEVWLHLLLDVALLAWLLYWAGGSSNPFASAFLVPIALAAAALRPGYSLGLTAVCLTLYTLLLRFHLPLPRVHHGPGSEFALHVLGMWLNFLLSAGLICGLVMVLALSLRRRDTLIARAREDALRGEHILAVGTLAAGAAHELSTPLATIDLLAAELAEAVADRPEVAADLALLRQQVGQCKASLSTLLAAAGQTRLDQARPVDASAWLAEILEPWQLLRPEIRLSRDLERSAGARLRPDSGLAQALIALLNNAADASRARGRAEVEAAAAVDDGRLRLELRDYGPGIAPEALARAGRAVFTSKTGGHGLGLLLSNASVERLGGQLSLHPAAGGGTRTRLLLPLAEELRDEAATADRG